MYLLDTNVISELNRLKPAPAVESWIRAQYPQDIFVSVVTFAELVQGVRAHPDPHQRENLRQWIDGMVRPWLADSFLPMDLATAELTGDISGTAKRRGIAITFPDAAIAATAIHHRLTLVTRNTDDFQSLSLPLLNPWKYLSMEEHS